MSATLRYRGDKTKLVELAKNLDAFKKVPEKYTETTEIGGTLSLISRLLIIYLVYKEVSFYYNEAQIFYEYKPDIVMDEEVPMHVDITVASPCELLSDADVIDETENDAFNYRTLERESVPWQMSPTEQARFESMQIMNNYLREQYHSVANILFKDIMRSTDYVNAQRTSVQNAVDKRPLDACRIYGSIGLKKVAGILNLMGGHQVSMQLFNFQLVLSMIQTPVNLSHRINRLSFGHYSQRVVQPLEGDELITHENNTSTHYFLKIVPTEIHNPFSTMYAYQYAVTAHSRKSSEGQHAGIFFRYDWSALMIIVRSHRENLVSFVIRICAMISGIIVISGIVNALLIAARAKFASSKKSTGYEKVPKWPLLTETNVIAVSSPKSSIIVATNHTKNPILQSLSNVDIIVP